LSYLINSSIESFPRNPAMADQGFEERRALIEPAAERAPRAEDVGSGQLVLLTIQGRVVGPS
jgi:hypothetical protein